MMPTLGIGCWIVRTHNLVLAGALALLCVLPRGAESASDVPTQGQILATYNVDLAGFSLGEFRLNARFQGSSYQIQGEGSFSLFIGSLFRSGGTTTSAGKFRKVGLEPSSFTVSFEGGGKKETRRLSFADSAVSQVSILPPPRGGRRRVPVTKAQLADVIDPLSAAFLHMPSGSSICDETMPVFDGRLRFDLVLTPKRADDLPRGAPVGLSGPVAVCEVKFVPISGYKPDNAAVAYLSQTDKIEAWLVRLPQTTLYVPYWIGVPTPLGRGGATLTQIKVDLDRP
jgi:Protein of unknown function (DUF3108)